MNFSTDWEVEYQGNAQLSRWPWSDLVSLVLKYARPDKRPFHVLEIGFGAGANIPFFQRLDVEYFGIDGSETIVGKVRETYPDLSSRLIAGDFTRELPFKNRFDLVVDRAALTCNSTAAIQNCLEVLGPIIKTGGKYIGVDWYSTRSPQFMDGQKADDVNTRLGFKSGPFKGLGRVHFSDQAHILELFQDYNVLYMEHKMVESEIPKGERTLGVWNFVAEKL